MKSAAVAVIVCVLLSSCSSGVTELTERAMVGTLAVDYTKDEYEVAAVATVSEKSQSGEKSVERRLFFGKGEVLADAIRDLNESSAKDLYFSPNGIVLIGENAAEEKLSDVIGFICRDSRFRLDSWLLLCEDAGELATNTTDGNLSTQDVVTELIENAPTGKNYALYAYEAANRMSSDSFCGYLPVASLSDEDENGERAISIGELCIFLDDGRRRTASGELENGILLLKNRLRSFSFTLDAEQEVSCTVDRLRCEAEAYRTVDGYVVEFAIFGRFTSDVKESGLAENASKDKSIERAKKRLLAMADAALTVEKKEGQDLFEIRRVLCSLDCEEFKAMSDAQLIDSVSLSTSVTLNEH